MKLREVFLIFVMFGVWTPRWTLLWGIFRVNPGTRRVSFFLQQSMQRGINAGAVTRFDDLGLYILPTEHDARRLVGIRALEASRSPTTTGPISTVIENRSGNQNLREVKLILFRFLNKRLFSLTVETHSPYWKDAEEFIEASC